MDTLIDNLDQILRGFSNTLWLLLFSGIFSTILGTLLASFRVSPVASLQAIGTWYVNTFRNTPLVLILALAIYVIPVLGFNSLGFSIGFRQFDTFFIVATLGLSSYTAAFVCEAVRSGVNSVPAGQAEAARSVGMSFTQSLRLVVLPQAFRTVIPPLASTYIALAKNTSVVAIFGVPEAAYVMRKLSNQYSSDLWAIFLGIALGYILIVAVISTAATFLERRLAVAR
ncbi:amino acid ABC transporter permease [Nocardioides mesophilus]|uniref:Amino acid ABC transporter permease n=1 Tax=Nocardioides mesophilus TaxID=433659 RepID=A0A7G9R9I2_9ACTN|nr:amino acid ABC transporter permease [Nocardioides mesophilus]QNN52257.1 amino acid ABC transporter permease [Nocardioides mesophilus]